MKTKKIFATLALGLIGFTFISTTTVQAAALQSNTKTSSRTAAATDWIIRVRQMESKGGGMGLNETVGADALATSDSNGIDVHLQKNTEYGAAILLGASDYGKVGTVGAGGKVNGSDNKTAYMSWGSYSLTGTDLKASTTGNVTGIYELAKDNNWEWTAGGGTDFLSNIASRYRNIYETSNVGKVGDATVENGITFGNTWHGSGYANFATGGVGFGRGSSSYGVFSYNGNGASYSNYARACVVSGSGL